MTEICCTGGGPVGPQCLDCISSAAKLCEEHGHLTPRLIAEKHGRATPIYNPDLCLCCGALIKPQGEQ